MKPAPLVATLLLAAAPGAAHRLDEYLQATLLSVGKARVVAQMTLTPGVAVYPIVLAAIDADGDGVISTTEQQSYPASVLRDLTLSVDGSRLALRLISVSVPSIAEMKEGCGEIHLDFAADLPATGFHHKLTFENRHQAQIAAYQINVLVPSDRDIRILSQNRNYSQSFYELNYEQSGGANVWLAGVVLLLVARFTYLRMRQLAMTRKKQSPELSSS
jgi:hypothetical protein